MTPRQPAVLQLGDDAVANRSAIEAAAGRGGVQLPAGSYPLARGVRLPAGSVLAGAGEGTTWLRAAGPGDAPLLQVCGSTVVVRDLGLELPSTWRGSHDGDRGTAVTVGRYLYPAEPGWIEDVRLERVLVVRRPAGDRDGSEQANSLAIMGQVRGVALVDVSVVGGGTGLAVHWGAVGSDVSAITGPSHHPHDIEVDGLRVREAVEGFYISSAHDVRVSGARLEEVQIGFRLLPGDNTVRFAGPAAPPIGRALVVEDCEIAWNGDLYAIRVAGWGRSEVDRAVTLATYDKSVVRRCRIRALAPTSARTARRRPRAAVVLESAPGVELEDLVVTGLRGDDLLRVDGAVDTRLGRVATCATAAPA